MTVLALIVLIVASIFAGWHGRDLPAPWPWVVAAILVVLWIVVFVIVSGVGGGILNERVA